MRTAPCYPDGRNAWTATHTRHQCAPGDRPRTGIPPAWRPALSLVTCALVAVASLGCHRAAEGGQAEASVVTSQSGGSTGTPGDTLTAQMDRARILGDSSARVWFVIVSDFQCPYCKQFHDQSLAALRQQYVNTGKVRMAYINYPLQIHANAWPSAEAAMCAGAQGKFWQMGDALFASQSRWEDLRPPTPVLDSLAQSLGVDTAAMNRCMTRPDVHALIQADQERAERAGVNATPTVIIGSKLLTGAQPTQDYQRALDSALASGR